MKDAKDILVEANVCIYANDHFRGNTVIEKNSIIGGNSWVTKTIPAGRLLQTQQQQK
jgi:serine O-acetyltransferase